MFSVGWTLSPALGFSIRKPDSRCLCAPPPYGTLTLRGASFHRTCTAALRRQITWPEAYKSALVPLRSPLLRKSLLVSFPPFNDMLKLEGCSCPAQGVPCASHVLGQRHVLVSAEPDMPEAYRIRGPRAHAVCVSPGFSHIAAPFIVSSAE